MRAAVVIAIFIIYILFRISVESREKPVQEREQKELSFQKKIDITSSRFSSPYPKVNIKHLPEDEVGTLRIDALVYDH